jgi:hypothetical protein
MVLKISRNSIFFYSVGYILILKPAGVKSGPADASRKVRLWLFVSFVRQGSI